MKIQKDKSDYLSPVLVKELRQGLRSKVFTGWFLLTQILMIGTVIMGLIAVNAGKSTEGYNGLFWSMVGLLLLFVLPGRGIHSISREVEQNTMELVMLTRLTAWRIVFGKWLSYGSQILLLFSSILPYFILRYYLGGINLLADFKIFAILLILSMLFTSMAIAQSAYVSKTKSKRSSSRVSQVVGSIIFFYFLMMILGQMRIFRRMPKVDSDLILFLMIFCPLLIVFMLTIGASKIAPHAENYSARKRWIGFAFLLVCALLFLTDLEKNIVLGCTVVPMLIIWVEAITEDIKMIPSISQNLLTGNRLIKRLRFLFYPGWCSGLLYFVTTLIILQALTGMKYPDSENMLAHFVAIIGTIIMPLALVTLCFPSKKSIYKFYWIIQVCVLILVVILLAAKDEVDSKIMDYIYLLPSAALFTWEKRGMVIPEMTMPLSTTIICILILAPKVKKNIQKIREIELNLEQNKILTPEPLNLEPPNP